MTSQTAFEEHIKLLDSLYCESVADTKRYICVSQVTSAGTLKMSVVDIASHSMSEKEYGFADVDRQVSNAFFLASKKTKFYYFHSDETNNWTNILVNGLIIFKEYAVHSSTHLCLCRPTVCR